MSALSLDERAELEALRATVAKKKGDAISFKVSDKGCVCIMGIRRFPISLYPQELASILDREQDLRKFVEVNKARLSFKD